MPPDPEPVAAGTGEEVGRGLDARRTALTTVGYGDVTPTGRETSLAANSSVPELDCSRPPHEPDPGTRLFGGLVVEHQGVDCSSPVLLRTGRRSALAAAIFQIVSHSSSSNVQSKGI
jgi:hypothetical protein